MSAGRRAVLALALLVTLLAGAGAVLAQSAPIHFTGYASSDLAPPNYYLDIRFNAGELRVETTPAAVLTDRSAGVTCAEQLAGVYACHADAPGVVTLRMASGGALGVELREPNGEKHYAVWPLPQPEPSPQPSPSPSPALVPRVLLVDVRKNS